MTPRYFVRFCRVPPVLWGAPRQKCENSKFFYFFLIVTYKCTKLRCPHQNLNHEPKNLLFTPTPTFCETLQLVRACKCDKNVPGAFLIIFTTVFWPNTGQNCPFGLKWPKKFFRFFSWTAHQNFLIFCSKHSLWSQKTTFSFYCGNIKNGPSWPKLSHIWPKVSQNDL